MTQDTEQQEHYQLYKLLAFAIQELSYFASKDRMDDCLQLPRTAETLSNRAEQAIKRIEDQNPRFFAGYKKYQTGVYYPPLEGIVQP